MTLQSIGVYYKGQEVGKTGYDLDKDLSYFQYNPEFLKSSNFKNLFPYIIQKTAKIQSFTAYRGETFGGLIPMIADSLPDLFGNLVFNEWMKANGKDNVSQIQQLAYVGKRGMGALEYLPSKSITKRVYETIDIQQMTEISNVILKQKQELIESKFNHESLLNIFRVGGSAGGVRPKIIVSQEKRTGKLTPGDINYSAEYDHYLVKLAVDDQSYPAEKIEYAYYKLATRLGIEMQPSKLIDGRHFSTLRFDREEGEKRHVLTACGIAGWDFKSMENSSYENLFKLATNLGVSHARIAQLYQRMVFNVLYLNVDDHLKNFSFIFEHQSNKWDIAPAYDITYALSPLLVNKYVRRALSINGKRNGISTKDLLQMGDTFGIKNAKTIISNTFSSSSELKAELQCIGVGDVVVNGIVKSVSANMQDLQ